MNFLAPFSGEALNAHARLRHVTPVSANKVDMRLDDVLIHLRALCEFNIDATVRTVRTDAARKWLLKHDAEFQGRFSPGGSGSADTRFSGDD